MNSEVSSFHDSALRFVGLSTRELRAFLREYVGYGYDGFFLGAISDDFPSESIMNVLGTVGEDRQYAKELAHFRQKLDNIVAELIVDYSPPFAVARGSSMLFDLITLVSRAKLRKAVSPIVKALDNGCLKGVNPEASDVDLHFIAVRLLPKYHDLASSWNRRKISQVLSRNLDDERYAAVSFAALWEIEHDAAWLRIPTLVSAFLRSGTFSIEEVLAEFVAGVGIEGLRTHFATIETGLEIAGAAFSKEHVIARSGDNRVDTAFRLFIAALRANADLSLWNIIATEFDLQQQPVAGDSDRVGYCFSHLEPDGRHISFCTDRIVEPAQALAVRLDVQSGASPGLQLRSSIDRGVSPNGISNKEVLRFMSSARNISEARSSCAAIRH